jgi:hypothetical protein
MSRRIAAVLLAAALLTGCVNARRDARDKFVAQLATEGSIPRSLAACMVDHFFVGRSDDELRRFFARQDLTDKERADFAAATLACETGGSNATTTTVAGSG